jgi:decaprenylphospho-beta-D-ribofuranose 2-oxidase
VLWWITSTLYYRGKERTFVDELEGFTFFMDGNVRAKEWGERHGFAMDTIQQTFILPRDPNNHRATQDRLARFLKETTALLREDDLLPTLLDILFVPGKDDGFLLSATRDLPGFAVTFAFETSVPERIARIIPHLHTISSMCRELGGRVHLVKTVYARSEDLEAMYAETLPAFFAMKKRLDPEFLLTNDFLARIFPSHVPQT